MTITEFRRLCNGRRRMVRMADTWACVPISAAQAEVLFQRLEGRVHVDAPPEDGLGIGAYAWISSAKAEAAP